MGTIRRKVIAFAQAVAVSTLFPVAWLAVFRLLEWAVFGPEQGRGTTEAQVDAGYARGLVELLAFSLGLFHIIVRAMLSRVYTASLFGSIAATLTAGGISALMSVALLEALHPILLTPSTPWLLVGILATVVVVLPTWLGLMLFKNRSTAAFDGDTAGG